ncbi:hypothetical protein DFH09DRAFT_1413941 [Mycena vulgaris]|nr:hypothetical protein DFH09DRAFT_1491704 [Mycena vulgaris]KAJ6527984.1 hypothetical protein DFH09DRAFT_1413941 [Mycena vulgaris]
MRYPPSCLPLSSIIPLSTSIMPSSSSLIHLVTFVFILSLRYFIAAHWFSLHQSPSSSTYPDSSRPPFPTPSREKDELQRANTRTDLVAIAGARIEGLPPTSHSSAIASFLPPATPSFATFAPTARALVSLTWARGPCLMPRALRQPPAPSPRTRLRLRCLKISASTQEDALAGTRAAAARTDAERAEQESLPFPRLRTVILLQATLPRFFGIASTNSARN